MTDWLGLTGRPALVVGAGGLGGASAVSLAAQGARVVVADRDEDKLQLVARAAKEEEPCPTDAALAAAYGTSSLGRIRRLIGYIETRDLFVTRIDLAGKRSITIPRLGWTTAAAAVA